jgi:Xaa-Pro aminopeptidase
VSIAAPTKGRADRLVAAIAEAELDALIVGDLVRPGGSDREAIADLTWLTGFHGSSGLALLSAEERLLVTDFRYIERARRGLADGFELLEAERHLVDSLAPRLSGRVGFDPTKTSVRERDRVNERSGEGVELVAVEGLVGALRRVKDEGEIAAIAAAAELTDEVYAELEEIGLGGRSEREIALWAEQRMRELGASGPSFPAIVAAGPNGSLPHADPGERLIAGGELVVIDMGAIVDGYCSDCTRTYACGEIDSGAREVYGLVLEAQLLALEALAPDRPGRAIDAVARELISAAGQGEHFGHGLGHGVGISIHEPPRLSRTTEDELLAGDVVTVEPGIYLPGEFGVRIEDLVVVGEDGGRILTGRPKELTVVD